MKCPYCHKSFKNPSMVPGGVARAKKLSKARRVEIAKLAVQARIKKYGQKKKPD